MIYGAVEVRCNYFAWGMMKVLEWDNGHWLLLATRFVKVRLLGASGRR
jgi:hypothetical protein